jgi:hypothetical protein
LNPRVGSAAADTSAQFPQDSAVSEAASSAEDPPSGAGKYANDRRPTKIPDENAAPEAGAQSLRASLLRHAENLHKAVLRGDLEAVRGAHSAIGQILVTVPPKRADLPGPRTGAEADGSGAPNVPDPVREKGRRPRRRPR